MFVMEVHKCVDFYFPGTTWKKKEIFEFESSQILLSLTLHMNKIIAFKKEKGLIHERCNTKSIMLYGI